ncbi:MAG: aminotransferase class I/II-fold pyridoxal phosphate-dependent enzyme [Bacteroidales bacterium]|nr:aminotransferase class I/II-fold pyridoxal phosphate-dependent enzyme [Bacteroidales bacterium]
MIIQPAKRTESVKEYFFSIKNREMAKLNQERAARGEDPIINLGIGSPDGTPPRAALEVVAKTAVLDGVHGYQSYMGLPELRKALSDWYARYYGVTLDPGTEIQPLTGSKEGILLISLTFLNAGDKVLVPDPGYPTYTSASQIAEAEVIKYDLVAEKGWVPDFDALEAMDLTGVKMMWTNYPGMPTGARATEELYAKIADFGRRHGILIVNDNPYSFIRNEHPLSLLAVPGAKECCLEMNSLSKAHNMAGWRIGMVGGEADYIREILKVKSQMDSGMFKPLQLAAVEALKAGPEWFATLNAEYLRRAKVAGQIMDALGAEYDPNGAGLFVFGKIPSPAAPVRNDKEGTVRNDKLSAILREAEASGKTRGEAVSNAILYGAGVFMAPGFIFGHNGDDYIRISLCAPVPKLEKALEKVKAFLQI